MIRHSAIISNGHSQPYDPADIEHWVATNNIDSVTVYIGTPPALTPIDEYVSSTVVPNHIKGEAWLTFHTDRSAKGVKLSVYAEWTTDQNLADLFDLANEHAPESGYDIAFCGNEWMNTVADDELARYGAAISRPVKIEYIPF